MDLRFGKENQAVYEVRPACGSEMRRGVGGRAFPGWGIACKQAYMCVGDHPSSLERGTDGVRTGLLGVWLFWQPDPVVQQRELHLAFNWSYP